jgi:hypothetical protein
MGPQAGGRGRVEVELEGRSKEPCPPFTLRCPFSQRSMMAAVVQTGVQTTTEPRAKSKDVADGARQWVGSGMPRMPRMLRRRDVLLSPITSRDVFVFVCTDVVVQVLRTVCRGRWDIEESIQWATGAELQSSDKESEERSVQ